MSANNHRHWDWYNAVLSPDGPPSPMTRAVLAGLFKYANKQPGNPEYMTCFPRQATLAEASGLSERSICKHLARAESKGWIERELRRGKGKGWKNYVYKLTTPLRDESLETAFGSYPQGPERGSVPFTQRPESLAEGPESGTTTSGISQQNDPKEVRTNRLVNRPMDRSKNSYAEVEGSISVNSTETKGSAGPRLFGEVAIQEIAKSLDLLRPSRKK